jgi:GNAT superfamily N-acetyltransferase
LEAIVDTLLRAFEGYFVKFPTSLDYWATRFRATGVNWALSYGVFDQQQLIAFIIHAIGEEQGALTAFNTGTGVLPAYRGQNWVDQIYAFAEAPLQAAGITQWKLEVITENVRAIRVYERIGFSIHRRLRCFAGTPPPSAGFSFDLTSLSLDDLGNRRMEAAPSWDHTLGSISRIWETYRAYEVRVAGASAGWFVINPATGYVPLLESPSQQWEAIFAALSSISAYIKINNIPESRTGLLEALANWPLPATVDQFEMVRK